MVRRNGERGREGETKMCVSQCQAAPLYKNNTMGVTGLKQQREREEERVPVEE